MTRRSEDPTIAAQTPLAGLASVSEHGDAPMTSQQADELRALCDAHGVAFDQTLSRDAAAARLAELKDEEGIAPAQS